MKPTDLAIQLTHYLTEYLPGQRNVSPNTIKSYRDTFTLLLRFCDRSRGIAPERLELKSLDPDLINGFLSHLEIDRGCKSRTRNQRLAAIHAFFRYLQTELPQHLAHCQRIMAIPFHRHERKPIPYPSVADLELLFAQPDLKRVGGRRDAVLLRVLYDTGARVQELCDLSMRDVRQDSPPSIQLTGKGRKTRIVPLMAGTVSMLKPYIENAGPNVSGRESSPLFANRVGHRLTRSGIAYLIRKYCHAARRSSACFPAQVSPHTFRHTKAMHLLPAGNALSVIQAILGHVDINTVGIYASADLEMKRKAMERAEPNSPQPAKPSWHQDQQLLDWLRSL
jgi:site-specific recombinase XerD